MADKSDTGDTEVRPTPSDEERASDANGEVHDEGRSASAKRPYSSALTALPPEDAAGDDTCASGCNPEASDDAESGWGVKANGSDGETERRDTAVQEPGSICACPAPNIKRPAAYRFACRAASVADDGDARGAEEPAKGALPVMGEPPMFCSAESR
jgi:hypothetical protein